MKHLPDILTPEQISKVINDTKKQPYQVFFLTLYSMGLRLSEGLNLTINDIDSQTMQVHIREAKGWCHCINEPGMHCVAIGKRTITHDLFR